MSSTARDRLIQAGFILYPQHGYRALSVRQLAAEAGLSAGMFHHLFASKEAFVGELLQQKYGAAFEALVLQVRADEPVADNLERALWFIAAFVRDHLPWIHRIFADSADGVACVNDFIRQHGTRHVALLLQLIQDGVARGELLPVAPAQQFTHLMGSVVTTMVIGARLNAAGLLNDDFARDLNRHTLSDAAIRQRIRWALQPLLPSEPSIAKALKNCYGVISLCRTTVLSAARCLVSILYYFRYIPPV